MSKSTISTFELFASDLAARMEALKADYCDVDEFGGQTVHDAIDRAALEEK